MKIPLANPSKELNKIKKFNPRFVTELNSGNYIGGENVDTFEKNLQNFLGTKYVITVNSGTDAILFSLISSGIKKGDKVLVPSFTFFATVETIMQLGAEPIFLDINLDTYTIDLEDFKNKLTKDIKAVIPVHLFGYDANIEEIKKISNQYEVRIIEDVAQAFGSKSKKNKYLGTVGNLGAFSFFPSKTLGGIGDGGAIATNNYSHYKKIMMLKNHGQVKKYEHEIVGYNSRLDTLNSFVLNEKLKIFEDIRKTRQDFVNFYVSNLNKFDWIKIPENTNKNIIFNYFTIQVAPKLRNRFINYLNVNNIGSAIYYKKPIHLQKAVLNNFKKTTLINTEKASRSVLSLPLYSFPEKKELEYIISKIEKFK